MRERSIFLLAPVLSLLLTRCAPCASLYGGALEPLPEPLRSIRADMIDVDQPPAASGAPRGWTVSSSLALTDDSYRSLLRQPSDTPCRGNAFSAARLTGYTALSTESPTLQAGRCTLLSNRTHVSEWTGRVGLYSYAEMISAPSGEAWRERVDAAPRFVESLGAALSPDELDRRVGGDRRRRFMEAIGYLEQPVEHSWFGYLGMDHTHAYYKLIVVDDRSILVLDVLATLDAYDSCPSVQSLRTEAIALAAAAKGPLVGWNRAGEKQGP